MTTKIVTIEIQCWRKIEGFSRIEKESENVF